MEPGTPAAQGAPLSLLPMWPPGHGNASESISRRTRGFRICQNPSWEATGGLCKGSLKTTIYSFQNLAKRLGGIAKPFVQGV